MVYIIPVLDIIAICIHVLYNIMVIMIASFNSCTDGEVTKTGQRAKKDATALCGLVSPWLIGLQRVNIRWTLSIEYAVLMYVGVAWSSLAD